jgi:hypothetical protein
MGAGTQIEPSQEPSIGIEIFLSTQKVDGIKQEAKHRELQKLRELVTLPVTEQNGPQPTSVCKL